jgi:hypothetical protein
MNFAVRAITELEAAGTCARFRSQTIDDDPLVGSAVWCRDLRVSQLRQYSAELKPAVDLIDRTDIETLAAAPGSLGTVSWCILELGMPVGA